MTAVFFLVCFVAASGGGMITGAVSAYGCGGFAVAACMAEATAHSAAHRL